VSGSNIQDVIGPGRIEAFGGLEIRIQEDQTITITGGIRNSKGAMVAELNNAILTGIEGQCDLNSDDHAYEIVVDHWNPVLQLVFKDENSVLFLHYLSYGSRHSNLVITAARSGQGTLPTWLRPRIHLQRIFKYPGGEFPGVRTAEAEREEDLEAQAKETTSQLIQKLSSFSDQALLGVIRALCGDLNSLCRRYPPRSPSIEDEFAEQSPEDRNVTLEYLEHYAARAKAIREIAKSRHKVGRMNSYLRICYDYPIDADHVQVVKSDICGIRQDY
jgi:hypothetical protein